MCQAGLETLESHDFNNFNNYSNNFSRIIIKTKIRTAVIKKSDPEAMTEDITLTRELEKHTYLEIGKDKRSSHIAWCL